MPKVLHVALEGGPATFGGLGRVATQMFEAQNQYKLNNEYQFEADIITPLYPKLYSSYTDKIPFTEVEFLYDNTMVKAKIWMVERGRGKHYLIEPQDPFKHLFDINSLPEIYADTYDSNFIDRVKFSNCATAALLAKMPDLTQIVQLHDYQAALVPKLLKELYGVQHIKSVFTMHIDNGDSGGYPSDSLNGIGLQFRPGICLLKALGFMSADKIVAVSPSLLRESIETSFSKESEFLKKVLSWQSIQKKTIGICNGIKFDEYCAVGKLISDPNNIYLEKLRIKQMLARILCDPRSPWKIDPSLPLILFVGRYSPEKGPETFAQVIETVAGKAIFIAVGRSMTEDVFEVIIKHSRQTDNVFVTFSEAEQAQLIEMLRAAADIIFVPSHREAFGLVAAEGGANGAVYVGTGAGGLKNVATRLNYSDKNKTSGNGFIYEDMPEGGYNPSLTKELLEAINLLTKELSPEQINAMQIRIMEETKSKFDLMSKNGPLREYLDVYNEILTPKPTENKLFTPKQNIPKRHHLSKASARMPRI